MAIEWQRLELPYRRGDADITVFHWADTQLAAAWFRYARQLANDQVQIGLLDVPFAQASFATSHRQARFMRLIVEALANGYNALNIPWYNHPTARSLWREWWSGPAGRAGGEGSTARSDEFVASRNWNDAWYKGAKPDWMWPVNARLSEVSSDAPTLGTTRFHGRIGQSVERAFRTHYPRRNNADAHPIELVPQAGLTLGLAPGVTPRPNTQIVYEPEIVNKAFAFSSRLGVSDEGGVCPPTTDIFQCMPGGPVTGSSCIYNNAPCARSHATREIAATDWRSFVFDEAFELFGTEVDPRTKLAAYVPLREHLPWLQAWTNAVAAESPESIILAARDWVWQVNAMWQDVLGGEDAFLSKVVHNSRTVLDEMHREDPTAQAVAGGIGALGSTLGAFTFGISALVGGAVSTVIRLADAGTIKATQGFGRDDIGRYKPVYERGWLTGDAARTNVQPSHAVPVPEGMRRNISLSLVPPILQNVPVGGIDRPVVRPLDAWIREATTVSLGGFNPNDAFRPHPLLEFPFEPEPIPSTSTQPPVQPPPPAGMSTGTKVALAVGGIAAVGAIVYVASRRPPRQR